MSGSGGNDQRSDAADLAHEREEELDETARELDLMSNVAAAGAGLQLPGPGPAIDDRAREVIERAEMDDLAFLAERFRGRPQDRVALFDLVGDPIGYGALDGMTDDGLVKVLVPSSAIDVVGSAKTSTGDLIPNPAFAPIPLRQPE